MLIQGVMVLAGKDGVLNFLELDDPVDAPPEHEAETTGILTNQSMACAALFNGRHHLHQDIFAIAVNSML